MLITYTVFMVVGILGIVVTGWVMHKGAKPYSALFFNIHKFLALGFVLLLILSGVHYQKLLPFSALIIVLLCIAGLLIVALFATGGILNHQQAINKLLVHIHKISSFLIVTVTTILMWVFIKST